MPQQLAETGPFAETGPELPLLTDIPLGLIALDGEWRFTYLNQIAEHLFKQLSGRSRDQFLGKSIWEECPEVADSTFAKEYRQAAAEQRTFELEAFYPALNRWFLLLASPSEGTRFIYFQDITRRKSLERSLHVRLEQMVAADRGKDEFLVHLAHEIRNALTAIQNTLYLAAGDGQGSSRHAQAVSEREVRYLSGVMNNLLKISQLALGRIRPKPERVDLTEVIARAAQGALTSSGGRGRSFTINLPADPLWAEADPAHMEEVVSHLLDNAVHFTHVGNHIWVSAERQEGEVIVRVEDNGVGIAAESLTRIFDMFMQRDGSQERTQGGLGTGLTLVRRLVELQGGTIEVFSEGPGKGSTFTVRLPAPVALTPRCHDEDEGGVARRILVVDNNAQAAESVALLLDAWGYESRVAYDGPSALEAADEWRPQVVLLDIGMPGMDGYEVARQLRERPELEGLTLIAVTGYGEEEDRRRSREVGFDYHMVKPVPPEDLKELLAATEAHADREGTRAQP